MKTLFYFTFLVFLQSAFLYSEEHLKAFWSFEDSTARDFSGNEYHGKMMNTPTPALGHNGIGTSMRFEGYGENTSQGDHILLPRIPFEDYQEFTISMWVKEESFTHRHGEAYIFFGDIQNGCLGIQHHIKHPDIGQYEKFLQVGVGTKIEIIDYLQFDFPENGINNWKFYVLTYKDNEMSFYIDGEFVGSKTQAINISNSNAALARTWWFNGASTSSRFNGWIDDVKIYDKALTEKEIEKEFLPCDETSFSFQDTPEKFNYISSGELVEQKAILTKSEYNKTGAMWYYDHVPVSFGFEAEFSFVTKDGKTPFNESDIAGADGISFVLQTNSTNFVGSSGGYIGSSNISNALIIEIDLFKNADDPFNDENENHIAIFAGKDAFSNYHSTSAEIAVNNDIQIIYPDSIYFCKVKYSPESLNLKVWLGTANKETLVLDLKDFDLRDYVDLIDNHSAFVGLTSATGNAYQTHEIHSFDFCIENNDFISSINEQNLNENIVKIYPQPALGEINIDFKN